MEQQKQSERILEIGLDGREAIGLMSFFPKGPYAEENALRDDEELSHLEQILRRLGRGPDLAQRRQYALTFTQALFLGTILSEAEELRNLDIATHTPTDPIYDQLSNVWKQIRRMRS